MTTDEELKPMNPQIAAEVDGWVEFGEKIWANSRVKKAIERRDLERARWYIANHYQRLHAASCNTRELPS